MNIAAVNEHVPEIKRAIRTIKERTRAARQGLPYTRFPRALKIALVKHHIISMNLLPHEDGISEILSPRAIVTGIEGDYNVHCRVE